VINTKQLNFLIFYHEKVIRSISHSISLLISNLNAYALVEVSLLCKAITYENLEEVNKLIKAGADVNAKSNAKMLIHYAITYNCLEIIKALRPAKKRYRTIFNAI
jgi:ankyrin repeat protein